jgi:hypothetical protein
MARKSINELNLGREASKFRMAESKALSLPALLRAELREPIRGPFDALEAQGAQGCGAIESSCVVMLRCSEGAIKLA